MQPERHTRSARARLMFALAAIIALAGCLEQRLEAPALLRAPYAQSQLWAVAPFINESGSTLVETYRIADSFAEQVQQVEGLDAVPVNRVIAAMRQLEMDQVRTPEDAGTLARMLGVDGLLVGTVSAYDPYPPPKLGLAVQLYHRHGTGSYSDLDPRALTKAMSDAGPVSPAPRRRPSAQAAGVFDAANHQTLQWLRDYARGRSVPDSAYGDDVYLVSMELFTEFASYRLIHDLLTSEPSPVSPVEHDE